MGGSLLQKKRRLFVVHSKVVVDSVSLSSWLHMWARMCKVLLPDSILSLTWIFCRAALASMTSPSGFNLFPGFYSAPSPFLHTWQLTLTPYCRVIFNVICSRMRVDYITRESLRNFYENFSGLAGDNLEKVATEGYRSMSAVSSTTLFCIYSSLTFRMGIMSWTTKATSCFSQTSSLGEQSMDLVGYFTKTLISATSFRKVHLWVL